MSSTTTAGAHAKSVHQLERATGALATASIARMEERLPWYRAMPPDERSWVGLVAQAGIAAFVDWYRNPGDEPTVTADVFGTAPRELTRAISLQQTVEMVRVAIDVVEQTITEVADEDGVAAVREGVLRYSREVAFAAAEVYARAAEARGAWDARLEALVVDALLRGESDEEVRSRAAALGWTERRGVTVSVGRTPSGDAEAVVDAIRRTARQTGHDVLTGVQGDRLVVVLGGVDDPVRAATSVAAHFGPGPVVAGPLVPDLAAAAASARSAVGGVPGRSRLAGRAPPGGCRRPAAGAGARRRRARPARPGRRGVRAHRRDRPGRDRDAGRLPRAAGARSRRPPGCCSCTPTPSATGCAGSRTCPA